MIKIIRVKKTPMFDVFVGDGWMNHTRCYYKGGKVSFVGGGIKLSSTQYKSLLAGLPNHV
jgi:hypothetical protein